MNRANAVGNHGEEAVCLCLEGQGAKILERDYRIQGGEIDIIAAMGDEILFVEVKTRKAVDSLSGYEAVSERKRRLLIRTAVRYCEVNETNLQPRFDVAVVCMADGRVLDIDYLENAFDMSDCDIIF